jgi:hypothetical protein
MLLASLETGFISEPAFRTLDVPAASSASDRVQEAFDILLSDQASFDERFADFAEPGASQVGATEEVEANLGLSPPAEQNAKSSAAGGKTASGAAPNTSSSSGTTAQKRVRIAEAQKDLTSELDGRTAIYDISARVVYLPNGRTLEAHSGLGELMDDPRYVHVRRLGPTPPNVYALSMREQPFHGVHALRLTPIGGGNMYGRDGILAHSYMLGPNGQSNGCVSFNDYQAFLNAYLSGEINRIVVIDHLATAPSTQTASGWFSDFFKSLFIRS